MAKKVGNGGNGLEDYSLKDGRYISVSDSNIKNLNLKISNKGDLELASQKIIETKKDDIIAGIKKIVGLENIADIKPNPKITKEERNDDNRGIDYYLITNDGAVLGLDDKTGINTKNFVFEIFKNVDGKDVTAWFTNKYKRNDLLSFCNLKVDEKSNITGCEYDFFDSSCLSNCVYEYLGITNPNVNPDSYLYNLGRSLTKNVNGETRINYKKNGKVIDGAYIRIKNKPNDRRGNTVSVYIEIDKDKIRNMCEDDEYQFIDI